MISTSEWIRQRCTALVDAEIGAWSHAPTQSELGRSIYTYADASVSLSLLERGLTCSSGGETQSLAFEDITEVVPLTLAELGRLASDPDARVTFTLKSQERTLRIVVPLKLYSTLHTILLRIVADRLPA